MFVGEIGIVTLLIASLVLAEKSDITSRQINLNNVRGKRDTKLALSSNEFSKRALMGFQGMRGKKDVMGLDFKDDLIQDDFEKRTSMGFRGIGEKKSDLMTPDLNEAFYNDDYEKRAPMGFQGMRGKKTMFDDDYYKRAIMRFQGMRGKKSLEEIYEDTEKRNDVRLPEMMLTKLYLDEYPDNFDKRAMKMGFQGMRGKKNDYDVIQEWYRHTPIARYYDIDDRQNTLEEFDNLEKKAIMGFQGMRGKKEIFSNNYAIDPFIYEKRAPMGFQGVRGKRNDDKRGRMGFVGMRGKRNERSVALQDSRINDDSIQFNKRASYGFFDMRGKKIPRWEIRGKFIGVRGKKWTPGNSNDGDNLMSNDFDNIQRIDLKSPSTTNFASQ